MSLHHHAFLHVLLWILLMATAETAIAGRENESLPTQRVLADQTMDNITWSLLTGIVSGITVAFAGCRIIDRARYDNPLEAPRGRASAHQGWSGWISLVTMITFIPAAHMSDFVEGFMAALCIGSLEGYRQAQNKGFQIKHNVAKHLPMVLGTGCVILIGLHGSAADGSYLTQAGMFAPVIFWLWVFFLPPLMGDHALHGPVLPIQRDDIGTGGQQEEADPAGLFDVIRGLFAAIGPFLVTLL